MRNNNNNFKLLFLIQIICKQLYIFNNFYVLQIISSPFFGFKYSTYKNNFQENDLLRCRSSTGLSDPYIVSYR